MQESFMRTAAILGEQALERLARSRVAVFGLGGVGGYVVEALARSGVGELHLIDNDKVSVSNLNRQIFALTSTVGRYKTQVAKERVGEINPQCKVVTYELFYTPDTEREIGFSGFDYVVDAIDTVSGKLAIIRQAKDANVPVISSMGTGNKLNASAFDIADISKTSVCPLARTMRRELKKLGIEKVKVLYSKEEPVKAETDETPVTGKKSVVGSVSFVPSVAGLLIAGEVIRDLIKE